MNRSNVLSISAILLFSSACDADKSTTDDPAMAAKADAVTIHEVVTADAQVGDNAPDTDPAPGTGLQDAGAVNQLPGFDMDIVMDGDDIVLNWEELGFTYSYDVWRSTEAYFNPGDPGSVLLTSELYATEFSDVGGAADDTSYYYRVEAMDGARSTTCGKYVHDIHTRYNKVSQPLLTGITSGLEFADTFDKHATRGYPYKFKAADQKYVRARPGKDFAYGPAECPIIFNRTQNGAYKKKVVGHVPDYGEMGLPLYAGHNYVTLPLWYGDMNASELLDLLPADAAIAGFTGNGLGDPYSADGGADFSIGAGTCIAITLTGDASWPPPNDAKEVLSTEWEDIPEDFRPLNPDQCNYYVDNGSLIMEPSPNTVWYNGNSAFQLGQPISGDFAITSYISATQLDGSPVGPEDAFAVAGLLVRDPDSATPNTYHCGFGNGGSDVPEFEYKSTVSGSSTLQFSDHPSGEGEVRICRVGTTIQSLLRNDEGEWEVMDSRERADLPEVLECGPIAYSDTNNPNFRGRCDYMKVKTVYTLEDCLTDEEGVGG